MSSIRGVDVTEPLQHWKAMCEEWCFIIERYSGALGGEEHIFDYTERPHVGALAAAAWRSGRLSLEEFRFDKQKSNELGYCYGRCDLWVSSDDLGTQEYVEAKHCSVSLSQANLVSIISPRLGEASNDAVISIGEIKEVNSVGACFVSIYDKSRDAGTHDRIEYFLKSLRATREELGFHAMAWVFPPEATDPEKFKHALTSNVGVVMLARGQQA